MVGMEVENREEQKHMDVQTSPTVEMREPSKRVVFDQSVRVILIPSRGEYRKVGLYSALWWNSFEFGQFQSSAQNEIRALATAEGIGARAARRKLYQPTLGANGQWCETKNNSDEDFQATRQVHVIGNTAAVLSTVETGSKKGSEAMGSVETK